MEIAPETALQICCNSNKLELTIGHRKENGRDQYRFMIGRSGEIPWVVSAPYLTAAEARRQLLSVLFCSHEQVRKLVSDGSHLCQYLAARRTVGIQQNDLLSGQQIAWIAQQLERSSIITTTAN